MLGKTLLKLCVIIFNFFSLGIIVQASEYDFVMKTIIEPYVLTGASAQDISHTLFITAEQNWHSTDNLNKITAQINLENISFQINDIKYQHSEIYPGELYYAWSQSFQRLTFGYQYLLLVDGFDTVGMESLNPENLNLSFFSKNNMRYRSVPAINYRLIFNKISVQFINSFQPKASRDNIFLFDQIVAKLNYSYIGDQDESKFFNKNDYGLRISGTTPLFDWSFYGLYVYDKSPIYQFDPAKLTMSKTQRPFRTFGGNFTFDFNNNLIRFDFKFNEQRSFLNKNFEIEKSNEYLLNLGYDLPEFMDTRISFNYSHSELNKNIDYLSRRPKVQDVYVRFTKKLNYNFNINSILLQRVSDSGYAAQFEIEKSISKSHEFRLGAEYFSNKEGTAFGLIKDFSRIYIGINSYTSN